MAPPRKKEAAQGKFPASLVLSFLMLAGAGIVLLRYLLTGGQIGGGMAHPMRQTVHYDAQAQAAGDLNLANMGLVTLTQEIFKNMKMQVLRLNNNKIETLPKAVFDGLSTLRTLHLDTNLISSLLPKTFSSLLNLQHLDMSGNKLTKVPSKAFKGLRNLVMLSLGGNQLKTLPSGLFKDLSGLQHLSLNFNQIDKLPSNAFWGLANVQKLFMYENKLEALPPGIFSNLTKLQVINLDKNPMKSLPANVYQGLVKILDDRNELEPPPQMGGGGMCMPPMLFSYQGPCWNDSDVVMYDKNQGYMMLYDSHIEDVDTSLPLAITGEPAARAAGKALAVSPTTRMYNVTALANRGYFCGIRPAAPPVRHMGGWVLGPPALDWWSVEGFLALTIVMSWAPAGWVRYMMIGAFVLMAFLTHPPYRRAI